MHAPTHPSVRTAGYLYVDDINQAIVDNNPAYRYDDLLGCGIDRRDNRNAIMASPFVDRNNIYIDDHFPPGLSVSQLQVTDGQIINAVAGVAIAGVGAAAGIKKKIPDHQLLHFTCYYLSRSGMKFDYPRTIQALTPEAIAQTRDVIAPPLELPNVLPWLRNFFWGPRSKLLTIGYLQNFGTNFIDTVQFGARLKLIFQVDGQINIDQAAIQAELANIPAIGGVAAFYEYMRAHRIIIQRSLYYISGLRNLPANIPIVGADVNRQHIENIYTNFSNQAIAEDGAQRLTTPMRFHYTQWANINVYTTDPHLAYPQNFYDYQGQLNLYPDDEAFYVDTIWELGLSILRDEHLTEDHKQLLMQKFPVWIRNTLRHIHDGGYFTISTRKWPNHRLYVQRGNSGVLSNAINGYDAAQGRFRFEPQQRGRFFEIVTEQWPHTPLFRSWVAISREIQCTYAPAMNEMRQRFYLRPQKVGNEHFLMLSTSDAPNTSYVRTDDIFEGRCRGWTRLETAQDDPACHFTLTPVPLPGH